MSGFTSLEEALSLGTGIERSFLCPVHEDRNPSASVNSLTGFWYCYTCTAWGQVDMDRLDIDPLKVKYFVDQTLAKMSAAHQVYPEGWLSVFDSSGPGDYWLSRFNPDTCAHYRLGQSADRDYATIPMRDNSGAVLGVIRRDLTGHGQKYKYPRGRDVTKHVFDLHRKDADILIVTEGATDAMACWESGFNHGVAFYGTNVSRAQQMAIRRYNPSMILTGHDQDGPGEAAHKRVVEAFGNLFPVKRMFWDTYKDIASIPVQERTVMLTEILQEKPRNRLARPDKTRVASASCGSSRPGVVRISSCGTRQRVAPKTRPSDTEPL